jgi:chromate transporter
LIGRKLGGRWGIVASLAGLLVPSAAVTCLLTAGFVVVQHSPVLHAVLRGIIPATAGIMGVVAVGFARPLIRRAQKEGVQSLSFSVTIMLLSALALIIFKLPAIAVLVGAAVLGVAVFTPWRIATPEVATPDPAEVDQPQ